MSCHSKVKCIFDPSPIPCRTKILRLVTKTLQIEIVLDVPVLYTRDGRTRCTLIQHHLSVPAESATIAMTGNFERAT